MKAKLIGICIALSVSSVYARGNHEEVLFGVILGSVLAAPRTVVVQPQSEYRVIERPRVYTEYSCSNIYDSVERSYCLGAQERRRRQIYEAEQEAYRRGLEGR